MNIAIAKHSILLVCPPRAEGGALQLMLAARWLIVVESSHKNKGYTIVYRVLNSSTVG